jgi:hypothetical protein
MLVGHISSSLRFRSLVFVAPPEHHLGTVDEQQIARNVQALKTRLRGRGGARSSGRGGRTRGDPGSGRDSHTNSECVTFIKLSPELTHNAGD